MNAPMTARKQTQWMAGTVAVLGSLLTVGGQLMLAEHYSQTGASADASGYYVAGRLRVCAYKDIRNSRSVFAQPSAENS